MLIRAQNGNIYNIFNFDSISKQCINPHTPYTNVLVSIGVDVFTIFSSNSNEKCDKVINYIWEKINADNEFIDIHEFDA